MSTRIAHDTVTRRVTGEVTHQCLAGTNCRAATATRDTTTGKTIRAGATTEKPNTLCRRCFSAIRVAVEDLPQDYADLSKEIGERQHAGGEKVHSTPDPPSPMDLSKDELMGEIYRHISSASDRVYRITGRCYKGGSTPRKRVAAWSEHISNHLDALIASPVDIEEEWAPGKGESVQYRDPDTGKIRYRPDMRVIERNGVDAGLKLVDLHSRAQSILNASTTGLRKLPLGMPGCPDCGEVLYTDGQKVLCRACARDWTEETAGMYERERQHVIEELRTQLAAVTAQRDAAWERCDQAQVLADAVYQPDFDQITVVQFGELLTGILKEHPTPEKRSQTTKNEPAPDPADS